MVNVEIAQKLFNYGAECRQEFWDCECELNYKLPSDMEKEPKDYIMPHQCEHCNWNCFCQDHPCSCDCQNEEEPKEEQISEKPNSTIDLARLHLRDFPERLEIIKADLIKVLDKYTKLEEENKELKRELSKLHTELIGAYSEKKKDLDQYMEIRCQNQSLKDELESLRGKVKEAFEAGQLYEYNQHFGPVPNPIKNRFEWLKENGVKE